MSDAEKDQLKHDIDALDGEILDTFSENCTHLTINNLKVTVKVLQCLTYAVPIVTTEYWKAYLSAIQKQQSLPNCDNFIPKLIEPYLDKNVSIAANVNRRRVFMGKTFAFMVKRHKNIYEKAIELAGGKCISLDELKCRKNNLIRSNMIVVNYAPSTQSQCTQDIENIGDYIRTNNLRMIPDYEIGLAIIHCSTEKFCNPKHKIEENFMVSSQIIANEKSGTVLAENTPSSSSCSNTLKSVCPDIVVPESFDVNNGITHNNDKKTIDSNDVITIEDEEENVLPTIVSETHQKHSETSIMQPVELLIENEQPQITEKPSSPLPTIHSEGKRKMSSMSDAEETDKTRPSKRLAVMHIDTQREVDVACSSQSMTQCTKDGWFTKQQSKQKLQQNKTNEDEEQLQQEPLKAKKRSHDLLQDDDDDSDDDKTSNLFQFNTLPSKKKKANPSANIEDNNQDDGLFNFPKRNVQSTKKPTQEQHQNRPQNQISNVSTSSTTVDSTTNMFHRSTIEDPSKTASTNWLSRSLSKNLNLNKTESTDIKKEETVENDNKDESDEWLKSMRNTFLVKVVSMNLSAMSINNKSVSNESKEQTTNVTNFKSFVKKYNYQTQTPLLKTIDIND